MKIEPYLIEINNKIKNEIASLSNNDFPFGSKKKIFFYLASSWNNNLIDCTIALALKLRGHNVEMIIPDCIPITEDYNGSGKYDHNHIMSNILKFVVAFDLSWIPLSKFIDENEYREIIDNTDQMNLTELSNLASEEIPIGKYGIGSANYIYGIPAVPGVLKDKVNLELAQKYAQAAQILVLAGKRLFKTHKPDVFISVGGKSAIWAPLFELAEKFNIECVNWEDWNTVEKNIILMGREQPMIRRFYNSVWTDFKNNELKPQEKQNVYEFFKLWEKSDITPFKYQENKNSVNIKELIEVEYEELISFFPNIIREDNNIQCSESAVFDNQIDFLIYLIDWITQHPEKVLVIRAHPVECMLDENYIKNKILDLLLTRISNIPPNVILLKPESEINSYALAEQSDKILVWNGTIGLELALKGKNVIVCGKPGYYNKGFTSDVITLSDLNDVLNNKSQKLIEEDKVELAEKYAYLAYIKCRVPFPFINYSEPQKYSMDSVTELLPNNNPVVDFICSNIVENGNFIYPPKDTNKNDSESKNRIVSSNDKQDYKPDNLAEQNKIEMSDNLVSVICCTYNRPGLVKKALKSLGEQNTENFEVLVVNDGGTDIGEIVNNELKGKNFRYFSFEQNKGLAAALDYAIDQSKGKYLMFIDDDNEYLPDHISVLRDGIVSSKKALVYTDSYWMFYKADKLAKKGKWEWDYSKHLLYFMNYIDPVQVILNRDKIHTYGDFDRSLRVSDWDLWVRFAAKDDILHIPKLTSLYGIYNNTQRISADFNFDADTEKMIAKYSVSNKDYLSNFSKILQYNSAHDKHSLNHQFLSEKSNDLGIRYIKAEFDEENGNALSARTEYSQLFYEALQDDPVFAMHVYLKLKKYLPLALQVEKFNSFLDSKINATLILTKIAEDLLGAFFADQNGAVGNNFDFYKKYFPDYAKIMERMVTLINEKPVWKENG